MRTPFRFLAILLLVGGIFGCDRTPSSDDIQSAQQEKLLQEGTSAVGMPAVVNHRRRKQAKDIIELLDQEGLVTYTYVMPEVSGKLVFFCTSVGYPLPYATQFTNPEKIAYGNGQYGLILPQADPDGLFSPSSAEGTWVMCKDPRGDKVSPVYVEPRIVVSQFKME